MAVVEHRFRVMACGAHVIVVDPAPGAIEAAVARLRELERRWSRFIPSSELSRVNATDGPVAVSTDTIALVGAMRAAHRATAGAYDPTLFRCVLGAPSRSPDDARTRVTPTFVAVGLPCPDHGIGDVDVDVTASTVCTPVGLALDPGGVGKGLAADLVVADLLDAGSAGALVSVGGDLAAGGEPPSDGAWRVGVEAPADPSRTIAELEVVAGGVATSSTVSRRWWSGGEEHHHLVDPATGRSSRTDVVTATIAARSGWLAEVHATAAVLAGSGDVERYARRHDLTGVIALADGTIRSVATTDRRVRHAGCVP